jgi:hypothetical protein
MAGETEVASEFELALIEVLSDAGCLERSLSAAAKEARNTGHRDEADRLTKAVETLAGGAQDLAIALMDAADITDAKHFAWANDPDGSTSRELALARAAARSLQVHLERVAKFAQAEAPVQEAKAAEAKADAEKASLARALEAARAAGAAAKAAPAAAAKPAPPAAAPAAAKADAPAPAKAAPGAANAAPAKATPQVAKATPKK